MDLLRRFSRCFPLPAILAAVSALSAPLPPRPLTDGVTRVEIVRDGTALRLDYTVGTTVGMVRLHGSRDAATLPDADSILRSERVPASGTGFFTLPPNPDAATMFFAVTWDAAVENPDPDRLAWIAPGWFALGSPETEEDRDGDEGPLTTVGLPRGFFVGRHEVTQAEYEALMGTNPSCDPTGPNLPVNNVTWEDAAAYASRLQQRDRAAGLLPTGFGYRLPTEAEWEYAARAGRQTRFGHGDDPGYVELPNHAWFATNSGGQPHPVGALTPNPWGLHDLHGNVAEWCADAYEPYVGGRVIEPFPASGPLPVVRGGSYEDDARFCRSAFRYYEWTTNRSCAIGFRIALVPQPAARFDDPLDLVRIEPGSVLMGSPETEEDRQPDEGPATAVTLTRGFWIGRFEVTQAQFSSLMATNPSLRVAPQLPVESVDWTNAVEFCRRLTVRERSARRIGADLEYRLPTEAEWEYVARAGTRTRFAFGDDPGYRLLPEHAVFLVAPPFGVGSRAPNPWGVHDLHGNVAEWCSDWYGPYAGGTLVDPAGPGGGFWRVYRGGSWDDAGGECRSAYRGATFPEERLANLGFRVVLAAVAGPPPFPGIELVAVPAGSFLLGSPEAETGEPSDEQPLTPVTLTEGFLIGRYEVTRAEYFALTGQQPSTQDGIPEQPVESVSWEEAVEFCRLLTEFARQAGRLPDGRVYRLPTEAEWEYAARAGTSTAFSFGDDPGRSRIGDFAWYLRNSEATTHPVGRRQPNPWGLHDVHGNVGEWCWDWYGPYSGTPELDPSGPPAGDSHVIRGGTYADDSPYCRSAFRLIDWTGDRFRNVGFRVVLGRPLAARSSP